MFRSALPATLLVAGLLLGGIGYAWADGGGDHHHGSVAIKWTNPASTSTSHPYVTCSGSFTPTVYTVSVQRLAPGDTCTIRGTLVNTGAVKATLSSVITIRPPSGCASYTFTDNVAGNSILGGGTFSVVATLTLLSTAGNSCETASAASISDVISATCAQSGHEDDGCEDR